MGYFYSSAGRLRAFLCESNGQGVDLNDLVPAGSGWTLEEATAINDAGEIVGTGAREGVPGRRGFLLTRLTPARRIEALIATIESFGLPGGIANSFITKLQSAQAALEASDTATACGDLQAFVNHTEAQSGKKVSLDQARQMIEAAEAIRGLLGCS